MLGQCPPEPDSDHEEDGTTTLVVSFIALSHSLTHSLTTNQHLAFARMHVLLPLLVDSLLLFLTILTTTTTVLDETKGDVLKNFEGQTLVQVARALLSITMFFTYPMESFVARHVLMQLLFNGNMDNTTINSETGEVVPERKWLYVIGRREFWTILLYFSALVPALIFSDLGPVLSLTGSLGASCISYIAPGLAYIGLNGDDFLARTGSKTGGGSSGSSKPPNGEVELPVAGDATATMQTPPEVARPSGSKPWWWWPLAMPIWVSLASTGARGCENFFDKLGGQEEVDRRRLQRKAEQQMQQEGGTDAVVDDDDDHVFNPRKSDYCYSVFFIVFGVIAAVAGVLSNIYIQVNKIGSSTTST